jgi:hypothetical protein
MSTLPERFSEVWSVDFEFRQPSDNSERPWPLCMVARELRQRHEIRLWRKDLLKLHTAPFDTGKHSLMVAFAVAAEASCFLAFGWRLPENILDLYAEHLLDINGLLLSNPRQAYKLEGAMARHRLPFMSAEHKDTMRRKIINQEQWSAGEMADILAYCAEDVDAAERLLQAMVAKNLINWPQALWRGAYMARTAHIEHHGIPVDVALYRRLRAAWPHMRRRLIARIDAQYGVFVGDSFNRKLFARYLAKHEIPWPRLPSELLRLDQETFRERAEAYPILAPLRELTLTLAQMRSTGLSIGGDGRATT